MVKSRKRARNERENDDQHPYEQAAANESDPSQHKDLWFSDGSIVLSVENTMFRVHKTILCTHSMVFADVFSLPQPPGEDLIGDCPVVRLPDKARDFEHFLKALYDPFYLSNRHSKVDYDRVTCILRVSTKYQMATFRNQCILDLTHLYPSSLEQFDAMYGPSGAPWTFQTKDDMAAEFFKVFELVHELNVPELLPCAFYFCTQLSTPIILAGLSKEDSAACLVGRDSLQKMQYEKTYSFIHHFPVYTGCQCRGTCKREMGGKIPDFYHAKNRWTDLNPYTLQLADFSMYRDGSICPVCLKAMEADHEKSRKEAWEDLPTIFGLGTWEELRAAQMLDTSSEI